MFPDGMNFSNGLKEAVEDILSLYTQKKAAYTQKKAAYTQKKAAQSKL
jgi:hypothetical protein